MEVSVFFAVVVLLAIGLSFVIIGFGVHRKGALIMQLLGHIALVASILWTGMEAVVSDVQSEEEVVEGILAQISYYNYALYALSAVLLASKGLLESWWELKDTSK
ncbi:hypothetical protein VKA52_02715 [Halobacillus sp. HZG1]|uniref:hypothetical protein n=1 Tax=Halobacillus sp. HZG1 TaxID=3111769 RepID=UPI002DBFEEC8|nr:hypothetical protein [Halobacillus sp. HZG1]MEC3882637.1 hypothetical protein [Halobacillus sp. HZG1]